MRVARLGVIADSHEQHAFCMHARSIERLDTRPRLYASSTILSITRGSYALAPVSSLQKRASSADRSSSLSTRRSSANSNVPGWICSDRTTGKKRGLRSTGL